MAREDLMKVDAVILDSLSGGIFSVKLPDGRHITAKLSGRLRKFNIRVIPGDKVTIGFSPYDLSHGLILSRERLDRSGPRVFRR